MLYALKGKQLSQFMLYRKLKVPEEIFHNNYETAQFVVLGLWRSTMYTTLLYPLNFYRIIDNES